MKGNKCNYRVNRKEGCILITLLGEMDHHNAAIVRGEIDGMIKEERPERVELDLSEIGFMDSSGLGFVMGRYSLTQKIGSEFVLKNPNERTVKIFELAGLERIIKIENDTALGEEKTNNE